MNKVYAGGGFVQMDATKEGTCRECGEAIKVGERITWKARWGASHIECGLKARDRRRKQWEEQKKAEKPAEEPEGILQGNDISDAIKRLEALGFTIAKH